MLYLIKFLRRKILINSSIKLLDIGEFLLLSVGFVALCMIADIALVAFISKIFTNEVTVNINKIDDLSVALVSFCLPSTLCLSVLPIFVSKKMRGREYCDLGLKYVQNKKSSMFKLGALLLFILSCRWLFLKYETQPAMMILLVFIFVGINEEVFARGVLFDILRNEFKPFAAAVIASLIFAFILHSAGGFYNNICIRFPLSLLLFGLYKGSGDIYSGMLVHMSYNILVNCI